MLPLTVPLCPIEISPSPAVLLLPPMRIPSGLPAVPPLPIEIPLLPLALEEFPRAIAPDPDAFAALGLKKAADCIESGPLPATKPPAAKPLTVTPVKSTKLPAVNLVSICETESASVPPVPSVNVFNAVGCTAPLSSNLINPG